jgi:hypothetical protein
LVIEAVNDLVTNDSPDCTVVDGRIRVGIEERRLQDRSREDDLVTRRL